MYINITYNKYIKNYNFISQTYIKKIIKNFLLHTKPVTFGEKVINISIYIYKFFTKFIKVHINTNFLEYYQNISL